MTRHGYALAALRGDYIRAGLGVTVATLLLAFTPPSSTMFYVAAGLLVLFAGFAIRLLWRRGTVIEADDGGITARAPWGRPRRIAWGDLRQVGVRYYSTRRDRTGGWMDMKIKGTQDRIAFDSALTGFADLALDVARAAEAQGLSLDDTTRINLAALSGQVPA